MKCGIFTSAHRSIGYNVHHIPECKDDANDGDNDDGGDDNGADDDDDNDDNDISMTVDTVSLSVLFQPFHGLAPL